MTAPKFLIALVLLATTLNSPYGCYAEGDEHQDEESHGLSISPEIAEKSGLTYETAGPGFVETVLALNGRLQFNEDKVAHLTARFPGVVKEVNKRLGDRVQKGEVLATIESNVNLQRYQIAAPFDGTILKKHASIGEYVEEKADIFMLADLSDLWTDLYVFPQDFDKIKAGQRVKVVIPDRKIAQESSIFFISSVVDELTQAKFARCVVHNRDGLLFPGQFVTGEIHTNQIQAPVVVKSSALQILNKKLVIFTVDRTDGDAKPLPVVVGRSGPEFTEITQGLSAGTTYFAGNTLTLRAEVQKGEFKHEH